jgi:hypothetical protein
MRTEFGNSGAYRSEAAERMPAYPSRLARSWTASPRTSSSASGLSERGRELGVARSEPCPEPSASHTHPEQLRASATPGLLAVVVAEFARPVRTVSRRVRPVMSRGRDGADQRSAGRGDGCNRRRPRPEAGLGERWTRRTAGERVGATPGGGRTPSITTITASWHASRAPPVRHDCPGCHHW